MPNGIEEKVDKLVTDMAEVRTALKGYNGTQGLIPAFIKHCSNDDKFRNDYYSFKKWVMAIFFILVGSGVLGVGGVKIAEVLTKGG